MQSAISSSSTSMYVYVLYIYIYIHTSFPNLMHHFKILPYLSHLPFPKKNGAGTPHFRGWIVWPGWGSTDGTAKGTALAGEVSEFQGGWFFGTFNIILINQWLGMQFFISTFSATVKLEDINFFRGAVKVWSNLTNGCCFPFHLGEWWIHQPDWSLLKDSPTKNYSFWTCSWRM